MADTGNRVEVRYGAFCCTIEGYEDPVGRMREVLALMQRMIAETPALSDDDSGLDDAQFARLDQALADWRTEVDGQGTVVIRSGDRVAGDTENAEVLDQAAERENREAVWANRPGYVAAAETSPHPAAVYSAPAAAAAEAALAAGMTSDDPRAQEPLGDEVPKELATPAALFAAPAADLAEGAFSRDPRGLAEPADADDDADDTDTDDFGQLWADEAAAERLQDARIAAAPNFEGEPRAAGSGAGGWQGRVPGSDSHYDDEGAKPFGHRPDVGAAEDAWSAPSEHAPVGQSSDFADGPEPLPEVNIFAPPPKDAQTPAPSEWPGPVVLPGWEREPTAVDPGAADRDEVEEPDEMLDDEAGDWPPASDPRRESQTEEDGPEREPSDTTENRLAALITRYQSGGDGARANAAGSADTASGISAAELAERAGATDVADLLAVSAAWLTLAGERSQFSRREVMEVFEALPGDHPRTLEARIKGFGNLVRSGKLLLVEDGAFVMPLRERTHFRELADQR